MADRTEQSDPFRSPTGSETTTDPRIDFARRDTMQFIATTLHEIQDEQGRQKGIYGGFEKAIDRLTNRIDTLHDTTLISNNTVNRLEPQVIEHNNALRTTRGIIIGFGALVSVVGIILTTAASVLYFTNASRIDKLIKVLDSPGINLILKKENK